MASSIAPPVVGAGVSDRSGVFAAAFAAVAFAAAVLAGWAPMGFALVVVVLFAGPHNWLEARYLLSRMPARWGPLRPFFLTALIGVALLSAASIAMPWSLDALGAQSRGWHAGLASWNTLFVAWAVGLAELRRRRNPRRAWPWLWPVAALAVAAAWSEPVLWGLGLVFLHPLLALWFLDRELGRRRPDWQPAWRGGLVAVPMLLGLLWWRFGAAPDLSATGSLARQVLDQVGAGWLQGVSTHFLVAAHVFLETLHYGVWVVALPLLAVRGAPWRLAGVPLARRSTAWRAALTGVLVLGGLAAIALWLGFSLDHAWTRELYFTIAIVHVLAEIPLLLWDA